LLFQLEFGNVEIVVDSMGAYGFRGILEDYFVFLATQYCSFLSDTLEVVSMVVRIGFIFYFAPVEFVTGGSGINNIKPFGVFDFAS
jgi:hypothetical protein